MLCLFSFQGKQGEPGAPGKSGLRGLPVSNHQLKDLMTGAGGAKCCD